MTIHTSPSGALDNREVDDLVATAQITDVAAPAAGAEESAAVSATVTRSQGSFTPDRKRCATPADP